MFKNDKTLQNFAAREAQGLYCVWTPANEAPGAPLIAVWVDSRMRAFETEGSGGASVITECPATEEAFDS